MKGEKKMPDKKQVINELQIINTWAAYAIEHDEYDVFSKVTCESILKYVADALKLLREQ